MTSEQVMYDLPNIAAEFSDLCRRLARERMEKLESQILGASTCQQFEDALLAVRNDELIGDSSRTINAESAGHWLWPRVTDFLETV